MEQSKLHYVNEVAKEGMIVAFTKDDKAFSGMIINILADRFEVKTKNTKIYNVMKENVIWVKTGKRWPKGIYQALRGEITSESEGK